MASLEELRAKVKSLQERQTRAQSGGSFQSKEIFPHWNAPVGTTSTVRFLPDADQSNTLFWVERQMIKLPFNGVKGEHTKPILVQVPCMEMYGEGSAPCPILTFIRPLWKGGEEEQKIARTYWKKKSYLYQGFVVNTPVQETDVDRNTVRRFLIGPQIQKNIMAALDDPEEFEFHPCDFVNGTDFQIIKQDQGGHGNYSTSKFAKRPRSLSDGELQMIKEKGLYDLKDYLPKKPGEEELAVIAEMFKASYEGEAYDPDRWSNYYRPVGFKAGGGDAESEGNVVGGGPKPVQVTLPETTASVAPTTAVESSVSVAKPAVEDVSAALAQLQAQTKAPAAAAAPTGGDEELAELMSALQSIKRADRKSVV